MEALEGSVDRETVFKVSKNKSHRKDTLMLALDSPPSGVVLDFDVTWDRKEYANWCLRSAHAVRVILLSREARWPGFIFVIWLFRMVAAERNYTQLHKQWRGQMFKSICLVVWACAVLEDHLLEADTVTGPVQLRYHEFNALLLLVETYRTFDFSARYIFWPASLTEPAQIRLKSVIYGIPGWCQSCLQVDYVVVFVAYGKGGGNNYADNVK